MDKEARQFLVTTFLLLAVAITSFVATSYATPHKIRMIALIFTAILFIVIIVIHYVSRK